MKNKIPFVLIILFSLFSFSNLPDKNFEGIYGVTANNPTKIELVLNKNKSFTYKDFSNPNKKIDIAGFWVLKNDFILLKESNSKYAFHKKWKISEDGKTAKSRKGLTFYTLCKR